jgi:hypothetical protein
MWGCDTGGFMSGTQQLTPELLRRWIQFSALTPVLRTKSSGIEIPEYRRPQIWDPEVVGVWARWAAWHTQLNGYLQAAHAHYRRTGFPIMAALGLVWPDDPVALEVGDQYLLGPHLLVAPVTAPAVDARSVHLPDGRWVDLWRAARYEPSSRGVTLTGVGPGAALVGGPATVTVPAPPDQIPLLVPAGNVLCLLSPDVDTLSPYPPPPGLVGAAAREDVRHLLAFPRGSGGGLIGPDEDVASEEGDGRWRLTVRGRTARTYHVQADLGVLHRPWVPARVAVDGRLLDRAAWTFDPAAQVLSLAVRLVSGSVDVFADG